MKTFKIMPLILIVCVFAALLAPAAAAVQREEPEVGAQSALLVELDTNQVFFAKHPDLRVYPASLTKIMTLLLVVEAIDRGNFSLYDKVTARDSKGTDLESDSESIIIRTGEVMTLENLIYCAMLASSNAACNIIAEYIAGSVPEFVALMNARAQELGCVGTNFKNVHGLHNEDHYTTAEDLVLIAREALSHDLFMEICNTVSYSVPATNYSPVRELKTTNHLINKDSSFDYYYEDASGVKTGYTSAAGHCLVSTATRDSIRLLSIVTGCEAKTSGTRVTGIGSFTDTIALYDWAFSNYSYQNVVTSDEIILTLPVEMASGTDQIALKPAGDISALLPGEADPAAFQRDVVVFSQQSGEELIAPISAGTVLGQMTVSQGDTIYGTVSLVAATSVDLSKLAFLDSRISATASDFRVRLIFWILAILTLVYLFLVIRYRVLRIRYVKALRQAEQSGTAFAPETRAELPAAAAPTAFEEIFSPPAAEPKAGLLAKLSDVRDKIKRPALHKEQPPAEAPQETAAEQEETPDEPALTLANETAPASDSRELPVESAKPRASEPEPSASVEEPLFSFSVDNEILEKLSAPIWTLNPAEGEAPQYPETVTKLPEFVKETEPPAEEEAAEKPSAESDREKAERDYFEEFFRKVR